jgi:penicillin-binding protein 1A
MKLKIIIYKISEYSKKTLLQLKTIFKGESSNHFIGQNENDTKSIIVQNSSKKRLKTTSLAGFKDIFNKKNKNAEKHTVALPSFENFTDDHGSIFKEREKQPNFYVGVLLKTISILVVAIFVIGVVAFGGVWGIAKAYIETTPTLNTEKIANQSETTFLYDANEDFLAAYVGSENREWANSDEIPTKLKDAFIAVEDVRFYYHSGIDIKRLIGAALSNFLNESVQGGSTITQQLIKNTLLSFDKTYKRKIQEAFLAVQLESEYSKDEILVSYLNTIDLGAGNFGVKAASKDYFDKELDELTLKECALLAGITQNPYSHNPRRAYYGAGSVERVENRIELVLNRMYEASYITKEERDFAINEQTSVVEESTVHSMYRMPYFVEYAIDEVITKLLESRNMKTDDPANRNAVEFEIRNNGYKIYTTVDPVVQRTIESSLANWDKYPKTAKSKDSVITTKNSDGSIYEIIQPQAAAVVYDYKTGQLRAIVGGRNNPDIKKGINRVNSTMPVGSSIKPIGVYSPAIDKGLSPASIIPNIPVPIDGWNTPTGYPSTSADTFGPMTVRNGLTYSINIVAARTLISHVGLESSKEYLISMGVNPKHINVDPAGLALGTSGITPVEMAVAFGCIANSGEYISPISFTKILDKDDNIIYDATQTQVKRQALKPSTAFIVSDILQDVVSKGTGKNARISGMNVGGKTGTNQENRGVYFSGITPYYSAAVWIGHDDYKPLKSNAYASSYAAPLWHDFMSDIHNGLENRPIIDASPSSLGLVKATVCPVSGLLALPYCTEDLSGRQLVTDWFATGTQPAKQCDVHQPQREVCAVTHKIANDFCPETQRIIASPIFFDSESPYLKLESQMLTDILPLSFPKPATPNGLSLLIPGTAEYATYFCTVHNIDWEENTVRRPQAIKKANKEIEEVRTFIQERITDISVNDANALHALIDSLDMLINDSLSSSEAIVEKTFDLHDFYITIKDKYESEPTGGDGDTGGDNGDGGDGTDDPGATDPFDDGGEA